MNHHHELYGRENAVSMQNQHGFVVCFWVQPICMTEQSLTTNLVWVKLTPFFLLLLGFGNVVGREVACNVPTVAGTVY